MMEELEGTQRALAEAVVWIRSQAQCPDHQLVPIQHTFPGEDEPRTIWIKSCYQFPEIECSWRDDRASLLDDLCEVLGTRDMSTFL